MLEQLKRQSVKKVLPAAALCLAAALLLLAVGGAGLVTLLAGPEPLYDYYGEELVGKYVQVEAPIVYDWYAETTRESGGSSTTISRDYIIDANDLEYIAIEVPAEDCGRLDEMMEQSWEFLDGYTDQLPEAYVVTGTVESMDAETLALYTEYLAGEDGELDPSFLPYIIKPGQVGSGSPFSAVLFTLLGLGLLGYGLFLLFRAASGGYQGQLRTKVMAEGILPQLEEFYLTTEPLCGVRADGRWVLLQTGATTVLLDAPDVLWAYVQRTRHRTYGIPIGSTWAVLLRTRTRAAYSLNAKTEEQAQQLLQQLAGKLPHLVTGYSDALNRLYTQDPARFAAIPTDPELQAQLFGG